MSTVVSCNTDDALPAVPTIVDAALVAPSRSHTLPQGPELTATPDADDGDPCQGALVVTELDLARRGLKLLDNCSVRVAPGEILAVMGPSGAGKSTLLKTIAGLAEPTRGRIVRPVGRVAMVFQDPRLLPWRTARQNVQVVLPRQQRDTATLWLQRVGLGDALDEFPAALSGGMRQRVAIARALACDAAIVLIDEPFSSLDAVTSRNLQELLTAELAALGRPAVWVTHDPVEASSVASRTLFMDGPPNGAWRLHRGPIAVHPRGPDVAPCAPPSSTDASRFQP